MGPDASLCATRLAFSRAAAAAASRLSFDHPRTTTRTSSPSASRASPACRDQNLASFIGSVYIVNDTGRTVSPLHLKNQVTGSCEKIKNQRTQGIRGTRGTLGTLGTLRTLRTPGQFGRVGTISRNGGSRWLPHQFLVFLVFLVFLCVLDFFTASSHPGFR